MIDFGIGLVPILGDFADAWFKCNTRNNLLLERYLREKGINHPVAPPPPAATKQSTIQRWFGSGPNAPGSHPGDTVFHDTAATVNHPVATTDSITTQPRDLPDRHVAKKGIFSGFGGGQNRDLEAQDENVIHYNRE